MEMSVERSAECLMLTVFVAVTQGVDICPVSAA